VTVGRFDAVRADACARQANLKGETVKKGERKAEPDYLHLLKWLDVPHLRGLVERNMRGVPAIFVNRQRARLKRSGATGA